MSTKAASPQTGLGVPLPKQENDLFRTVVRHYESKQYKKGIIGGIVNIVDQSIARKDIEARRLRISGQGQSVNDGEAGSLSFGDNLGGLNLSYAGSYSNLNDYKVPKGALTK